MLLLGWYKRDDCICSFGIAAVFLYRLDYSGNFPLDCIIVIMDDGLVLCNIIRLSKERQGTKNVCSIAVGLDLFTFCVNTINKNVVSRLIKGFASIFNLGLKIRFDSIPTRYI